MDNLLDFIGDFEGLEDLEFLSNPRLLTRPRIYRERPDFLESTTIWILLTVRYRLSKQTVLFLLNKIEVRLEFKDNKNMSVAPINQLLIALRFYATGSHLLAVADMGGVSAATCSRIVKRVSEAITTLRREFIKFAETEAEATEVMAKFYTIAGFPNVRGCIDCTHVKIQSPGGDDAELFRNRKSYMSINMETVSNADLLITEVVARWPGSTHDSAIYQNSNLCSRFERGDYGSGFLLGDSGYPLKFHLLTPYLNPATPAQQRYNEAHIKTRNVVERQYGVLKRRFPVLAVGIRLKLDTAVNVILACCVLHNICIIRKEADPTNENLIPNLDDLIRNGQINAVPYTNTINSYGFRRNQITEYFENLS